MQSFARNFPHLSAMFPPSAGEANFPAAYDSALQPAFDIFGTAAYKEIQSTAQSGTNGSVLTPPATPADKVRLYLAASAHHDGAGAQKTRIEWNTFQGGSWTALAVATLATGESLALQRHFYVNPNGQIRCLIDPGVGVGETLFFRTVFIDLPLGEYAKS